MNITPGKRFVAEDGIQARHPFLAVKIYDHRDAADPQLAFEVQASTEKAVRWAAQALERELNKAYNQRGQ